MPEIWVIILTIVLICAVFMLAVGIIDGNRFEVVNEEFELEKLKKNCRFVLISDLHNKVYGNNNDKVVEAVERLNPDFIILAGDLVTSKEREDNTPGIELLNRLSQRYRIYYGLGNHESKTKAYFDGFVNKYEKLKNAVSNKNTYILEDTHVDLPEYNIRVSGLELGHEYFAHFKIREMEEGYIDKKISKCDAKKCNLLIAHNPDYFEEYAKWGADLVLSGHVHGGIMRLPIFGGVIAPSYMLFPKYDGGVFKNGKSTMLLGRGMGSHTLPFRFFNPAQLYCVDLKPKV